MSACLTVARKELRDHLRDRRALATSAGLLLMGPAVVLLVSRSPLAGPPGSSFVLPAMASVFALVAALTGAMHMAMDTTAGERERQSLVPLRLCPISPLALTIGKWLAASTMALGGLTLTVAAFGGVLRGGGGGGTVLLMLTVLAPLALLGSAVHLLVGSGCRTTKEANAWLQALVFAPMGAGMFVIFFPGVLDTWLPLLPVVGQQLLMSQAMAGEAWSAGRASGLAAVTLIAVVPLLMLAGRALGRDDVLDG